MKMNDGPVSLIGDDDLDRAALAARIAEEIRRLDSSDGCVVAVNGAWGSGKTTLINFMESTLKDNGKGYVIWFNPWNFSGTDDLISRFFQEISTALNRETKFHKAANAAENLGTALAPMAGVLSLVGPELSLLPILSKAPKKTLALMKGGVEKQKRELSAALRAVETRFYIIIDDLDRLSPDEIRQMMRLVRLTGSLPTVTYILAFDRERVIKALSIEDGISGDDYIDKIVFASYDVPRINPSYIRLALEFGINRVLARVNDRSEIDQNRAYGLMHEVLLKEIRNLRGVKRFVVSSALPITSLVEDVDVLDVLCLESLRLFKPVVFALILERFTLLSWSEEDNYLFAVERKQRAKSTIEDILETYRSESILWVLKHLFPIAWSTYEENYTPPQSSAELIRDRRVGHRHFMAMYVERYEDRSLVARRKVDQILALNPEAADYDEFMTSMPLDQLADAADILQAMTSHIPLTSTVPLCASLLNRAVEEPVRRNRMFDWGVDVPARRVTERLLSRHDPHVRPDVINQIYGLMQGLQNRYRVLVIAKQSDEDGRPLLEEGDVNRFQERFVEDFLRADLQVLSEERWLLYLAKYLMESAGVPSNQMPDFLSNAEVAWALLRSSVQESMDSRSVETAYVMDLAGLDVVLGGRERTKNLVETCKTNPSSRDDDERYLTAADQTLRRVDRAIFGGELPA